MDLENYNILEGEVGFEIKLSDFQDQNKFILNSYGGEINEGFAIYDYLKKKEDSEIGIMGVCASSATIILLGAKKRWATKNSVFVIHNPWSAQMGDSKDFEKTAGELKKLQDQLITLYVDETGKDAEFISNLMNEEKFLNAEEALQLGLINEIREESDKKPEGESAKAMYFNLKRSKMTDKKVNNTVSKEELNGELQKFETSLFEKVKNFFKPAVKNIVMKDANGNELDFNVETEEEITVGVRATDGGSPADGDYTMEDGVIYTFEAGELVAINEPGSDSEEMEALKKENEELKSKIENLETTQAELNESYKNKLEAIKGDFEKFKNKFSPKQGAIANPSEGGQKNQKPQSRIPIRKKSKK